MVTAKSNIRAIRALRSCTVLFSLLVGAGRKPNIRNINAEEELIATRLVVKSNNALMPSVHLWSANVIPALAIGGTSAAAMATPGKAAEASERQRA